MELRSDPHLFPPVREPLSRWERAGLTSVQERRFRWTATLLVAVFVAGWAYSIFVVGPAEARAALISSRITRSPFAADAPPPAPFLLDAFVRQFAREWEPYRGESGAVNVVVQAPGEAAHLPELPDSAPPDARLELQPAEGTGGAPVPADTSPGQPGVWNVALRVKDAIVPASDLRIITLVPLSDRRGGRIGRYMIGAWPFERGGAPKPIYETPNGVVRVTPENQDLRVSEHFRLRDFLTKGQTDVWPKYEVLSPRLLDKLELTLQELERQGHPVRNVFVISGFRTPSYNASGGDVSGRGELSRHMYGDAADIAIDNNHDGRMDDLNGDGRADIRDARIVGRAAERVERRYPKLVGGIGVYAPTGAHAGFVHIDARGYRARWGPW